MYTTQDWTVTFTRSILGWMLTSARRKHAATVRGKDIPDQVRQWSMATGKKGVVSDPAATALIEAASKGGAQAKVKARVMFRTGKAAPKPPELDWNDSWYLGDGQDGVYYGVIRQGRKWWALATVDSNTGGVTQGILAHPCTTRAQAVEMAKGAAVDWRIINEVDRTD